MASATKAGASEVELKAIPVPDLCGALVRVFEMLSEHNSDYFLYAVLAEIAQTGWLLRCFGIKRDPWILSRCEYAWSVYVAPGTTRYRSPWQWVVAQKSGALVTKARSRSDLLLVAQCAHGTGDARYGPAHKQLTTTWRSL
jgi:hypothetical protein